MAQDNRPYNFDDIPDFAMKPARSTEDEEFDPSIYERLFYDLPALEPKEEQGWPLNVDAGLPAVEQEEIEDVPKQEELKISDEQPKEQEIKSPEIRTLEDAIQEAAEDEALELMQQPAQEQEPAREEELLSEPGEAESESTEEPETVTQDKTTETADNMQDPSETGELAEEAAEKTEEEAEVKEEAGVPAPEPEEGAARTEEAETKEPDSRAEPVFETQPASAPVKETPAAVVPGGGAKVIPIPGSVKNSRLKLTDIKYKPVYRVFIEEDILVPDVKPDLAEILSVNGALKLSEPSVSIGGDRIMSLRVTGDFSLQTLYIPQKPEENPRIINIDSRLPFKEDVEVRAEPHSGMQISSTLESLEYSVINERKFRVKAAVALHMREYQPVDIEIFDGIQDEGVQLLKEKIQMTDVACRKTEAMELEEELILKEPLAEIGKILSHDISIVENHKQVGRDKAVINALVYCNIMYLSGSDTEEEKALPVIYQGKTEFTQFVKLDDKDKDGEAPTGSRVFFAVNSASVSPKTDESGQTTGFLLNLNVDTSVEVYKTKEKEIVTDIYHQVRDMHYDTSEVSLMSLCGSGVSEVSAREVLNVPEKYKGVERVAFISGSVRQSKSTIEAGKCVIEGVVALTLICIGADEDNTAFSMKQDLPFRSSVEIPGLKSDMTADSEIQLKELWFDKLNNRQIEVNAGILVATSAMNTEKCKLIQSVSFAQTLAETEEQPGMVLYITGKDDDLWSIAKRYRTTIDTIKKINQIDYTSRLQPGTKLLIVK